LQSNFALKRRSNPSVHLWRDELLRFASLAMTISQLRHSG
jgi:hypothetical protein